MIKIIEFLLNIIYPNVCGICQTINKNSLCNECETKIEKEIVARVDSYNNKLKYFNKHEYRGKIRELLIDYKFNNKAYLYKTFSYVILNNPNIITFMNEYEVIIPVPIHKQRYNHRGYNQSELIAKEISKCLSTKFLSNVLIKTKNNSAQSSLNKIERFSNVKDVYKIKNINLIKGKKILLIDDIYTTGNTVNECSKVLKESGATEIGILTISKD